jgi:uncharacterized protein (DUF433 family)
MSRLVSHNQDDPWKRRLTLPAYQVKDAARYARVSPQTVLNWQKNGLKAGSALSSREKGISLSYMQLVELAFVSALRGLGVKLEDIRGARDYMAQKFNAEYPFAQLKFKTDGQDILMELPRFERGALKDKLIKVNKGGQTTWTEIIGDKFEEFDYSKGLAVRWNPAGKNSPIQIDPRVSFGAPAVGGVATWAIKGRWEAGESVEDIAEDFSINTNYVSKALEFEGINVHNNKNLQAWIH